MQINFARDQWNMEGLVYAYTNRFTETPVFTQQDDCVENKLCGENKYGFEQISLFEAKKYEAGVRISTRCSFDKYGAPLINIAEDLVPDANGNLRFGNYIEIVLYERGVNVWKLYMQDGAVKVQNLLRVEFPLADHEIHTLTTEITDKTLTIYADEHKIQLHVPELYASFYLGITACEGINHFYSMEIEEIKSKNK